jgi:putative ABC transport system permease protein
MLGNVKMLIGSICTVIVLTLLLVTASTMSMAIRERTQEMAVLKMLGFSAARLLGLLLAEAFVLAMAGGLLGCLAAWALLEQVDIYKLSRGLFVSFQVTPDILARGLLVAGLLGLLSCLWPAWVSIRQRVAAGIRVID